MSVGTWSPRLRDGMRQPRLRDGMRQPRLRDATAAATHWWVLTMRLIMPSVRTGEIVTSILGPATFTAGFYLPLNTVMTLVGTGFSSYAQFMMPLAILQAGAFTAILAAFRAATDSVDGLNRRFGSMPISPVIPMAARMSANIFRLVIALAAAIGCGYLIGFRFRLDSAHTIGFCIFGFLIGVALTLAADIIGTLSKSPEATSQLLMLPPLIFGMLSTGLVPAQQFPDWIQAFVRNQPVSQFVAGLRALAGGASGATGQLTYSSMGPPMLWLVGMFAVCIPLSIRLASRRIR